MIVALLLAAASQPLDLTEFFAGKTHADNVIKIALQGSHKLIVDSVGGRNKEGEFVLIETVREEGKPVRKRTWVMRQGGPDHYTGSLTDAVGPVDIRVSGNTATVRYVMKDGHLSIVQQMTLQPDGKTLANRVDAKRFGLKFARVEGTVRKLD